MKNRERRTKRPQKALSALTEAPRDLANRLAEVQPLGSWSSSKKVSLRSGRPRRSIGRLGRLLLDLHSPRFGLGLAGCFAPRWQPAIQTKRPPAVCRTAFPGYLKSIRAETSSGPGGVILENLWRRPCSNLNPSCGMWLCVILRSLGHGPVRLFYLQTGPHRATGD